MNYNFERTPQGKMCFGRASTVTLEDGSRLRRTGNCQTASFCI